MTITNRDCSSDPKKHHCPSLSAARRKITVLQVDWGRLVPREREGIILKCIWKITKKVEYWFSYLNLRISKCIILFNKKSFISTFFKESYWKQKRKGVYSILKMKIPFRGEGCLEEPQFSVDALHLRLAN